MSPPNFAQHSFSGGGCWIIGRVLFLLQQCLDVSVIFVKPILLLSGGSAHHFCGSSIDSVSEDCPVWLNIIGTKA